MEMSKVTKPEQLLANDLANGCCATSGFDFHVLQDWWLLIFVEFGDTDKRMKCQDLPFLENLAYIKPPWCHMAKEQKNPSIDIYIKSIMI